MTYYSVCTLFTTRSFEALADAEAYYNMLCEQHNYVELKLVEDYKFYRSHSLRVFSR